MNSVHHLTDDQIDDALIGDLASDCAAHLAACEACRIRLAEAEAPIASFNAVALAWSERRSATLPGPARESGSAWLPKALWAASAAVVLAVGVSVSMGHHSTGIRTMASAPATSTQTLMASTGPVDNPVAAREERIAHDNQLLENINRELDVPAAASLANEYGLQSAGHAPDWRASTATRN